MQVNKIDGQSSFQAKFKENTDIKDVIVKEIGNGRHDEIEGALKDLAKHHKNVVLEVNSDGFKTDVTNLYNNKTITFSKFNTDSIKSLNNTGSREYKKLFNQDTPPAPAKDKKMADIIASKYLVKSEPDYTHGRNLDASF